MTVRRWTFLGWTPLHDRGLRPDVEGLGATALSPFAFDMFVKPRLFAWLESFVAWHHVWMLAAYVASALTLVPSLTAGRGDPSRRPGAAWWAAVAYVVAGAAGKMTYLLLNPAFRSLPVAATTPPLSQGRCCRCYGCRSSII